VNRLFATKLLALLAALGLGGLALAQTTVTLWYSIDGDGALQTLIEEFNASHPDIRVEGVDVGNYEEMVTRLQAAAVSGRIPDLVQLEITRYGLFADRGVLLPLTELIENTPEFNVDDLIPGIWEAAQYEGTPFVVPFNNSVPVMYYNKDLFREAGLDPENPPRTWEELAEAARTLTVREGERTTQWGMNGPPQWVRHAFVRQNGGDWMDEAANTFTLDSPEAVEAYTFLAELIREARVGYPEAALDANDDLAFQDFLSGRTALHFDSTGNLGDVEAAEVPFEVGVAPLPCRKVCAAPIGGATLGILAGIPEERQQAAWDFIVWATNTENNAFWHTRTGYMPIRRSTLEAQTSRDFYAENPNFKVAIDQFEASSFPRPRPPAMPAIRELELTTWEEVITGTKTVEQALTDLTREANTLLAGN